MTRFTMAALLALVVLAMGGTAQAQSPVNDAYGGNNGVLDDVDRIPPPQDNSTVSDNTDEEIPAVPQENADREAGAPPTATGNSLPFTGLDVGLLALGGIAMLGVGVGLRRLSRTTG